MRLRKLLLLGVSVLILIVSLGGCVKGPQNGGGEVGGGDDDIPDFNFAITTKIHNLKGLRDPFIFTHKKYGIYYMYGTYKNPVSSDGKGFVVYKSKNLVDWAGPFSALRADALPQEDYKQDFWAPEVFEVDGKYYMLGTVSQDATSRYTRVFVTDDLEKEFVPYGRATPEGKGAIDATLYKENGKYYSIFCEEWITRPDKIGTMNVIEMKPDLTDVVQGTERILFNSKANTTNANGVTDGPFMHRNQHGELFMIWSTFVSDKYTILYAVSQNGSISGASHDIPDNELFVHVPTPLILAEGGHAMIFRDLEDKLRITFHTPNNAPERPIIYELDDTKEGELSIKIDD